jgi:antitoxin MazE
MKTRIVRIGNSRGIRIPKPLLEQAGLEDEVQLEVTEDGLRIKAASAPRAGWADAADELEGRGEGGLLDPETMTRFDEEDWQW